MRKYAEIYERILAKEGALKSRINETELRKWPGISGNNSVYLKMENKQLTGSFKIRGAFGKILPVWNEAASRGVVTASTGNHGAAVAFVCSELGIPCIVWLPENTGKAKVDRLSEYTATLRFYGNDVERTETHARGYAKANSMIYVPPYNDTDVIAGQGTIGCELIRQTDNIDAVFIPVGGGGLASGIAVYLKTVDSSIRIIGCQPENSPVMAKSVKAGRIVSIPSKSTLADGTAGGIEEGSVTFPICRELIDEFTVVNEQEIKQAMQRIYADHSCSVEGAGALSVAAYLKMRFEYNDKNIVLIISGGNFNETEFNANVN